MLSAAVLFAAAACGPGVPGDPGVPAEFLELAMLQAEAQREFGDRRWDDAAEAFRRLASEVDASPDLAGWRDQALYNAACALARGGRPHEAAVTFAQSVEKGIRPIRVPDGRGGWREDPAPLSIPHMLADPDLDSIRDEPAYVSVLRRYLETETVRTDLTFAVPGAPLPVVVSLGGPGADPWADTAGDLVPAPGFALVRCSGPVSPLGPATPAGAQRWVLDDGDTRFAVAAVGRVLDGFGEPLHASGDAAGDVPAGSGTAPGAASRPPLADTGRVFLAGFESETATAALAAALAFPERVAGVVLIGPKQPIPDIADAVAAAAVRRAGKPSWRVVLQGGDAGLADVLRAAGARVTSSVTPAAAVADLLAGE